MRRLLIVLFALMPVVAMCQLQGVTVNLLSTQQGLADRDVTCAVQDEDGFIWLGTNTGLYKYDGYTFTNYSKAFTNRAGSGYSLIYQLTKDPEGNILVAYSHGFAIIPRGTDTFCWVNNPLPSETFYPRRFLFDQQGRCWVICVDGKIWLLDSKLRLLTRYSSRKKVQYEQNLFLYSGPDGHLWILCTDGSAEILTKNGKLAVVMPATVKKAHDINAVTIDFRLHIGDIWRHTVDRQLLRQHNIALPDLPATRATFTHKSALNYKDVDGNLLSIAPGSYKIWYNEEKDSTDITSKVLTNVGSLDNVHTIYQTSDKTLWLCTEKGLVKIHYGNTHFRNYLSAQLSHNTDVGISVRKMAEDDSGNIWIGAYRSVMDGVKTSLFEIEKKTGKVLFVPSEKNSTDDNTVYVLADRDKLWIAKETQLIHNMDLSKRSITPIPELQPNDDIHLTNISKISDSSFYFGGYNGMGILYPYRLTNKYTYFNDSGQYVRKIRVTSISEVAEDGCWVTTFNGIYRLNNKAQIVRHYDERGAYGITLPSNIVYNLYFDAAGLMWAATKNGLAKIDAIHKKTIVYTEKDGLCNDNVYAIVPDDWGYYWLSTNNGLSRFNPRTGLFINYYTSDNLPHNEFNHISFLRARSGRIYFGGLNGVTSFDPGEFDTAYSTVGVKLVSISRFDGDKNTMISEKLQHGGIETVRMKYNDKLLNIKVMLPSYTDPAQNRFSYKLENWDNEWQILNGTNVIAYSHLPAGNYKLRITGARPGETWSDKELTVDVIVQQAWFKTWWFYSLCGIAAVLLGYLLYRIRLRQVMREQKLRNKISADLHDELGSVLTQISLQSDMLKSGIYSEPEQEKELDNISTTSRMAITAMSDIVWSIKADEDRLINLVDRMRDHADMMLQTLNAEIRFTASKIDDQSKLDMQSRQQLFFIFKEAIHNILQHSSATIVTITVTNTNGHFMMDVTNNNSITNGSKPTKIGGNGLKNMQMRAQLIKGTITIRSENEHFTVQLKCKML